MQWQQVERELETKARFLDHLRLETKNAGPRVGDGVESSVACFLRRYEPVQVQRVCGFRHTLSAFALPGGIFGCVVQCTAGALFARRYRLSMDPIHRAVSWAKDAAPGHKFAEVTLTDSSLHASAVAIGVGLGAAAVPYRLDYEFVASPAIVTRRLWATTRGGGWERSLDLRHQPDGTWTAQTLAEGSTSFEGPGGDMVTVAGALDCDLQMPPLTNSMPVPRLRLLETDEPHDFLMAWVTVPALSVVPSRQR